MKNANGNAQGKWATIISNFFNPLTGLLIFFAYFSFHHLTKSEAVARFIPILLIIILPVAGWILWNVKKGNYKDANVSDRKKRMGLYFFLEATLLLYLLYQYFFAEEFNLIIFFIFLLVISLHISNYILKSSMHTAFNLLVAGFFTAENWLLGAAWFIITVIVGFSRVYLKRHTVAEVFSGGAIAMVLVIIYLYINLRIT